MNKIIVGWCKARRAQQNSATFFGILPLIFTNQDDWNKTAQGDRLSIPDVRNAIRKGNRVQLINPTKNETYETEHLLSPYQVETILAGSLINLIKQKGLNPTTIKS